eukprot:m.899174 g.899174  ORF g.899174 m.899174 type:complete len:1530 (+) comp60030_c0_seq1:227-4816(+)
MSTTSEQTGGTEPTGSSTEPVSRASTPHLSPADAVMPRSSVSWKAKVVAILHDVAQSSVKDDEGNVAKALMACEKKSRGKDKTKVSLAASGNTHLCVRDSSGTPVLRTDFGRIQHISVPTDLEYLLLGIPCQGHHPNVAVHIRSTPAPPPSSEMPEPERIDLYVLKVKDAKSTSVMSWIRSQATYRAALEAFRQNQSTSSSSPMVVPRSKSWSFPAKSGASDASSTASSPYSSEIRLRGQSSGGSPQLPGDNSRPVSIISSSPTPGSISGSSNTASAGASEPPAEPSASVEAPLPTFVVDPVPAARRRRSSTVWTCPPCGTQNELSAPSCSSCHASKSEAQASPANPPASRSTRSSISEPVPLSARARSATQPRFSFAGQALDALRSFANNTSASVRARSPTVPSRASRSSVPADVSASQDDISGKASTGTSHRARNAGSTTPPAPAPPPSLSQSLDVSRAPSGTSPVPIVEESMPGKSRSLEIPPRSGSEPTGARAARLPSPDRHKRTPSPASPTPSSVSSSYSMPNSLAPSRAVSALAEPAEPSKKAESGCPGTGDVDSLAACLATPALCTSTPAPPSALSPAPVHSTAPAPASSPPCPMAAGAGTGAALVGPECSWIPIALFLALCLVQAVAVLSYFLIPFPLLEIGTSPTSGPLETPNSISALLKAWSAAEVRLPPPTPRAVLLGAVSELLGDSFPSGTFVGDNFLVVGISCASLLLSFLSALSRLALFGPVFSFFRAQRRPVVVLIPLALSLLFAHEAWVHLSVATGLSKQGFLSTHASGLLLIISVFLLGHRTLAVQLGIWVLIPVLIASVGFSSLLVARQLLSLATGPLVGIVSWSLVGFANFAFSINFVRLWQLRASELFKLFADNLKATAVLVYGIYRIFRHILVPSELNFIEYAITNACLALALYLYLRDHPLFEQPPSSLRPSMLAVLLLSHVPLTPSMLQLCLVSDTRNITELFACSLFIAGSYALSSQLAHRYAVWRNSLILSIYHLMFASVLWAEGVLALLIHVLNAPYPAMTPLLLDCVQLVGELGVFVAVLVTMFNRIDAGLLSGTFRTAVQFIAGNQHDIPALTLLVVAVLASAYSVHNSWPVALFLGFGSLSTFVQALSLSAKSHNWSVACERCEAMLAFERQGLIMIWRLMRPMLPLAAMYLFLEPMFQPAPWSLASLGFVLAAFTSLALVVMLLGSSFRQPRLQKLGQQLYQSADLGLFGAFFRGVSAVWKHGAVKMMLSVSHRVNAGTAHLLRAIMSPAHLLLTRAVPAVWNSPLVASLLSLAVLGISYMAYDGKVRLVSVDQLDSLLLGVLSWLEDVWRPVVEEPIESEKLAAAVVTELHSYVHTVVQISVPSLGVFRSVAFAWAFFLFNVTLAYARLFEVLRVKLAVFPLLLMAFVAQFAPKLLFVSYIACALWALAVLVFAALERLERDRARAKFEEFVRDGRKVPAGTVALPDWLPASTAEPAASQECTVCAPAAACADRDITLTCGHRFHEGCLKEWFHVSRRCPACLEGCDTQSVSVLRALF